MGIERGLPGAPGDVKGQVAAPRARERWPHAAPPAATEAGECPLVRLPGRIYLFRPTGTGSVRAAAGTAASRTSTAAPGFNGTGGVGGQAADRELRAAVFRLLMFWLEALDGRRPVEALRRGPYARQVVERLRTRVAGRPDQRGRRDGRDHAGGWAPATVLSLHLTGGGPSRRTFCASVRVHGRIRAVVGHLAPAGTVRTASPGARGHGGWVMAEVAVVEAGDRRRRR